MARDYMPWPIVSQFMRRWQRLTVSTRYIGVLIPFFYITYGKFGCQPGEWFLDEKVGDADLWPKNGQA